LFWKIFSDGGGGFVEEEKVLVAAVRIVMTVYL
jgi:hypothetical protein